ncbi:MULTISPECIES: aldehyde dehydrogenase [Streptomyces]|uniref:Aldehyde dehydrogenase n=1 Tax=Streptomyces tsukubensis (strain DSM 42081 / NBRC 108919 / NRRL 18488 / 9993) TaxID=1114943 RepID=I2MUI2_STRT9|nr:MULTISPECIES: aldehyde dehydrogenase [Streptomyces]AZK92946.1 aldehyde dehydrogenase [Streptomyces tsukubensis]EIF88429.1 aldehyde dehydrogenase [Streptomyces tsukubensis NRRL18488]MYS64959.1 aldehyde dehydrogenase family protein [Streptomyces sp. SID5473]QKM70893.1 aldehyde dehydrogenase [Streptomyces tsukubensis NRRL18488]TAI40990.1 aldehyde dehydrogenase [Streptomyces tsukubensis]
MNLRYGTFYIGGAWVDPATDRTITPVDASTEQPLGEVPEGTEADIDRAVAAARTAFDAPAGWASWEPARRAEAMDRLADAIDRRADEFVTRVSAQNGMPVSVARQLETGYPSAILRYYAGLARGLSTAEIRPGLFGGDIEVRREPVGVVAAIVPWNFPQALAMFKIAPALATGCTLVVKPSPETVLDAYLLAEAVEEAGLPAGVVNIVPGGRDAGAHLVAHPAVDKVAFTGSTAAGRAIAETCGRLLRPVTLELGGKSAAIVLDDADLDLAEIGEGLFGATLLNNGQTCFLGTRILAPRSRYAEVVDAFTAFAGSLTVGAASDPATQIGPMATARQRERVESYIAKGIGEGARLTTGGGRPEGLERGWFVRPTVFADVDNSSAIAQEEIFGPVLSIIAYEDDDDAVRIADDSDFGLGGTVWTADPERGAAVARRVRTGTIGVNRYIPDPAAPFGGVKASGLGRELGPEGLTAYQRFQTIYR